jgi:hypothetical protein
MSWKNLYDDSLKNYAILSKDIFMENNMTPVKNENSHFIDCDKREIPRSVWHSVQEDKAAAAKSSRSCVHTSNVIRSLHILPTPLFGQNVMKLIDRSAVR